MQKFYGLVLLIIMVPTVLLVNFYAWSGPQGFTTDLTRVGGFPEEDFGWSGTEYKFAEPQREYIGAGGVYEKYTDMVVFGDSFSQGVESSWVSHFVNATGLSAQVMHYDQGGIERLIETGLYRSQPPRVVVFEILERMLNKVFRNAPVDCRLSDEAVPLPVDYKPLNIPLLDYRRDVSRQYGDYKLAIQILRNKLFLMTGREKKLKPRVAQLTVDSLFSSKKSDQLLYFKGDHEKNEWPDDVAKRTRCGFESIRQRVEANGYTAFAVILVPDKLSMYSPWLVDDSIAHLTLLDEEVLNTIPHYLDVSALATHEVEQGFVDFYLPGDTHWSSKGDRQVAQWMLELFQADSALHP
jgi:hypothetical protein